MRVFLIFAVFLISATSVSAYVPEVIVQKSLLDITQISNPNLSQTFFGELIDFPHTYQIIATEPFHLSVQISVPDIESSKNNLSGIIIKDNAGKGRVEEVARLYAKDALWAPLREWWSGDVYRIGPSFEKDLGPGVYRVEMSTPDNKEKYILTIGNEKKLALGYFQTLKNIIDVKKFFGKSPLRVIESPLAFIPLISISGVGIFFWYRRRQKNLHTR